MTCCRTIMLVRQMSVRALKYDTVIIFMDCHRQAHSDFQGLLTVKNGFRSKELGDVTTHIRIWCLRDKRYKRWSRRYSASPKFKNAWGHSAVSVCVCVCVLPSPVWLFTTPWAVTLQPPLSTEFFRQEYWSGLPFPSPGDLPDPGIEPGSASLKVDSSPSESPGKIHQGRASFRHPIYNKLNVACLQTWQCLCTLLSNVHPSENLLCIHTCLFRSLTLFSC